MTMNQITKSFANILNESDEFSDFCTEVIDNNFIYYLNIDPVTLNEIPLPYFSITTYNEKDEPGSHKGFQIQFLVGIMKEDVPDTTAGTIIVDNTLEKLENVVSKAIEIITNEIRVFGIDGDKSANIAFINKYVPKADGEEDLQMQIDIGLEQDKFLSC
ncbi:MAG: hypothetical protein JJV88_00295 [Sulfurovum sp.]|nr:hypothetical protein [Sulfurovaceae bacterium]